MLFHLSMEAHLDEQILQPRIPESSVNDFEDTITPRICFSETINGCLQALELSSTTIIATEDEFKNSNENPDAKVSSISEEKFSLFYKNNNEMDAINYYDLKTKDLAYAASFPFYYLYTPDDSITIKDCKIAPVFDQKYTHEIWVTKPVKVHKIATLYLLGEFYTGSDIVKISKSKKAKIYIKEYIYRLMPPYYNSEYVKALDEQISSRNYQGSEYALKEE